MYGEIDGRGQHLKTVTDGALARELMAKGAVLLRNFQTSRGALDRLASRLGEHAWARAPEPSSGVNPRAVGHFTPAFPDLVVLWCVRPAPVDGETLVSDGTDLYRVLSGRARRRLSRARLEWRVDASKAWFEESLGLPFDRFRRRWLDGTCEYTVAADRVAYRLEAPALQQTSLGPAVAHGLLGAMSYRSVDADAAERIAPGLDRQTLWEMMDAAYETSEPVEWAAGDVLVLDNRRSMHGSAPFDGRILERRLIWRKKTERSVPSEPRTPARGRIASNLLLSAAA